MSLVLPQALVSIRQPYFLGLGYTEKLLKTEREKTLCNIKQIKIRELYQLIENMLYHQNI